MMRTLSEAMESLVRRGFTEHFGVRGDELRGFESGKTFGSQDVIIREYERSRESQTPTTWRFSTRSRVRAESKERLSTPLVCTRIRRSAHI
jgi:hypothetical protein